VVTAVAGGGAAAEAGLREGDLIVEMDRRSTHDLEDFNERIRGLEAGDTILLRVVRGGRGYYVAFRV